MTIIDCGFKVVLRGSQFGELVLCKRISHDKTLRCRKTSKGDSRVVAKHLNLELK